MVRTGSTPTVRDVAQLAGVSPGTVSKVLNNRGQLREETRTRVQEAAKKLGFRPNHLARSLIEGRSYTVGILTSDSFGRFTMPVMEGIEDSLGAGQLSTLLCDGRGDPLRERHYLQELLDRRVDGLVVTGRRSDARTPVGRFPVPVIYVLTRSSDPHDLSVTYDDAQGGELAIRHLLAAGRKRVAFVGGPPSHLANQLRRTGAEQALAAAGLSLAPEDLLLGQVGASRRLSAFSGGARGPGGRLRPGDRGVREAGVRVPDDISVVGFDNWPVMAEASRPPLTTVDPKLTQLGRHAASLLLNAINGGELGTGVLLRPCDLVVRESSIPTTLP